MPRRGIPDEASRLFLRIAYTLDRRSRRADGRRLVPWDLDPVRLPLLEDRRALDDAIRRLAKVARALPPGFRRDWLTDHVPTLRALAGMVRGRVPALPEQARDL